MKVPCQVCGKLFEAQRSTARYCSDAHKKRAQRASKSDKPKSSGLVAAVEKDLTAAGVLDTPAGQQAMDLAARMVNGSAQDTGSAYAALNRELSKTLEDAKAVAVKEHNWLDELASKRQARISAA